VERQFKFSTTFHLSTCARGQREKSSLQGGKWKVESVPYIGHYLSTFPPALLARFFSPSQSSYFSLPVQVFHHFPPTRRENAMNLREVHERVREKSRATDGGATTNGAENAHTMTPTIPGIVQGSRGTFGPRISPVDAQPSRRPPPGAAERKQACDDVITLWRSQRTEPPVSASAPEKWPIPAEPPVWPWPAAAAGNLSKEQRKSRDDEKLRFVQHYAKTFKQPYCWRTPKGWLCELPSIFTPLIAKKRHAA
jgi:hypothetical protein